MARNGTISPDYCVQPLRPRTIRLQVSETIANHSNPSPGDGQGPRTAPADEGPPQPTPATETMTNHSNASPTLRQVTPR